MAKKDETAAAPTPRPEPGVDLEAMVAAWREVALAEDPDGLERKRAIESRLRRIRHEDIHPGEPLVELDVPLAVDGTALAVGNRAGEKVYTGRLTVPRCVAHQLLYMADQNRRVDAMRLRDGGRTVDLGVISGGERVARVARAVQADT